MRPKQTFFLHDSSVDEVEQHMSCFSRCNPESLESWAGHVTPDQVVALISPETAKDERILEVLRGQGTKIYVLLEDNS